MERATKRNLGVVVLLLLLIALVFWWRHDDSDEPRWNVSLVAERSTASPWSTVAVKVVIEPSSVYGSGDDWKIAWPASVEGTGARGRWKVGGTRGRQEIEVAVTSPQGTRKSASVVVEVAAPRTAERVAIGAPPEDPTPVKEDAPFAIAEVVLEKDTVCQGEESLITVVPEADDDEVRKRLVPVIRGKPGWSYPFNSIGREPAVYPIHVLLRDDATKQMVNTSAYIEVKDCVAPIYMRVNHYQDPTSTRPEFRLFRATIGPGPATDKFLKDPRGATRAPALDPPPASYRWDFGDGATLVTTEPTARHQFPYEGDRPGGASAQFIVRVQALDAKGKPIAKARTAVGLINMHEHLKARSSILQLIARYQSLPKQDEDGRRYVDVTLINWDARETAVLDRLEATDLPCKDTTDEPAPHTVPVSSVFKATSIPPQGTLRGRVYVDPKVFGPGKTCIRKLEVKGSSQPGDLDVQAYFRVTGHVNKRDLKPPTRSQKDVINAAFRVMYGEFGPSKSGATITLEDIARLEREGKIPAGSYDIALGGKKQPVPKDLPPNIQRPPGSQ